LAGKNLDDTQDLPHEYTPATAARMEHLAAGDADQLPAGARVGDYTVVEKIASGGGGTVYEAQAPSGRRVAIKVLLRELAASNQALSRFRREAEVVTRLHHPNIVGALEAGALPDGHPYIVMELVARESLRNLLQQRGRLSPGEMLAILEPTCSALSAAHAAGVVHRDLKASNISVGGDPAAPVVNLLDFGIAKLTQQDPGAPGLTVQGSRLGTPYAMAPEQIRGDVVDQRADVYALGVLVFQMLTGGYPFNGATPQEIERLHLEAVPPRAGSVAPVAPAVEAVVMRCLEKRPENRFASVDEVLAAVKAALAPAAQTTQVRPAVAIHVDVSASEDEDEAIDLVDRAESALRAAGFQIPLLVSTAVLGARPAEGDAEAGARALAAQLAITLGPSARVSVHSGAAQFAGATITGGALLNVETWPPR
jgi:serine/threonine protein kinase